MTSRIILTFLLCATAPLQATADCISDEDCVGDGEVCSDGACVVPGDSCWGRCGGNAPDCYCDSTCDLYGDCCADICEGCPEMDFCCIADCTDKECGDDGCGTGTSCGFCGEGQVCSEDGQCAPCVPDCDGKICGQDGCGDLCGSCEEGLTCAVDGSGCLDCGPCAPWETCKDGACVAPPISPCPMGGDMIAATCYAVTPSGCCAGTDLYYCESADTGGCPAGVQDCLCHVDCDPEGSEDLTCGWWEQLFMCAPLPAEPGPEGALECAFYECAPDCNGKVCGPNGCGGDCGDCGDDEACSAGLCVYASCADRCGERAPAGCWCDKHCEEYDDCCDDRCDLCPMFCEDDPCAAACATVDCGEIGECDCGGCAEDQICEINDCVVPTSEDVITEDLADADIAAGDAGGDAGGDAADGDTADGDTGGGGPGRRGGCATGDSEPAAGFMVLFVLLGLAAIRRRVLPSG